MLQGNLNYVCIFSATSGRLFFTFLDCLSVSVIFVPVIVGWSLATWFADTEILPAVHISVSPFYRLICLSILFYSPLSFTHIGRVFCYFFLSQPPIKNVNSIFFDQAEPRPDVTCNLLNGKQIQGKQPSAIC